MKKILIIGAGPAGLTTAYELIKQGNYNITIIEKEDKVGGISKTVSFNDKYLVDTGIHRFFSKNEKVNKIWKEILPNAMLEKNRYTRIYYQKKFFSYPIDLQWNNIKKLGFFTTVKIGFSYIKAQIFRKEENSLENFYINKFGKMLYNMFFEEYTEKVWGVHPSKISSDWGEQRVKGISILEVVKDAIKKCLKLKMQKNTKTSLIERFYYPKFGAGQMWDEMKKMIEEKGGKIITNAKLVSIKANKNKISQIRYIKNGKIISEKFDILISSAPIKDLIMAFGKNLVPRDIYKIAANLPYREFISIAMVVKKINFKSEGKIIKDNWIYIQEPNVKVGRLQIFNNWSPYLFKNQQDIHKETLMSMEYFCFENDEFWNMSNAGIIKFAKNEAVKIGLIGQGDLISAKVIRIEKAYPAYFGSYKELDKVIRYINSFENLYCVGRNGQHKYNNMDHSMLTGIEAAYNIVNNKKNKDNIWKVNTEKEYHEIKTKK